MKDVQTALRAAGFDPGGIDGKFGPATKRSILAALGALRASQGASSEPLSVVPFDWMPQAKMARVIVHWTAGAHQPNQTDKAHYHILIDGTGKLHRGEFSIKANEAPQPGKYAAHTLNANTGSIGVSLCGMLGAQERPFEPGPFPINKVQWAKLLEVLRDLCRRYGIEVDQRTVLTHAEVQANLGIAQRAKWDIAVLPWMPGASSAQVIGAMMRNELRALV